MSFSKAQIRMEFRARRRQRRTDPPLPRSGEQEGLLRQWEQMSALLFHSSSASPQLPALFVPSGDEPDISLILTQSEQCLLPALRVSEGKLVNEPKWALHRRGIPLRTVDPRFPACSASPAMPASTLARADVVLVPALGVDSQGVRLGQGGGWYDRALVHIRPGTPVVAVIFDEDFVESLPREPHDHPVDAVLTPTRTIPLSATLFPSGSCV